MNTLTQSGHLDSSGYVRRSRRLADLSQRELAQAMGTQQSGIARIEAGRDVTLRLFARILAAAGLRIVIVDEHGDEVEPMAEDVLRDAAGRRQPSHLDVQTAANRPITRLLFRSVDPTPRQTWYYRRPDRDRLRARAGAMPFDQPTMSSIAAASRERDLARRERAREHALSRARAGVSTHHSPGPSAGHEGPAAPPVEARKPTTTRYRV